MPRRQAGNKDHPQFPRAIRPDISVLLRDGQPLHKEIEGEPNPRKRRERERARDFARDCLFKMYRYAERRGKLEDLDIRVRFFCEESRERNAGILPLPTGGRPTLEHRRLSLAVHVIEEIEALGRKRGSIELALKTAANETMLVTTTSGTSTTTLIPDGGVLLPRNWLGENLRTRVRDSFSP
jgi:hypothetical protein